MLKDLVLGYNTYLYVFSLIEGINPQSIFVQAASEFECHTFKGVYCVTYDLLICHSSWEI